jgi:hypothetical protein
MDAGGHVVVRRRGASPGSRAPVRRRPGRLPAWHKCQFYNVLDLWYDVLSEDPVGCESFAAATASRLQDVQRIAATTGSDVARGGADAIREQVVRR